eukprot:Hpha_TRINITY_DN6890_c0_g2::TRINITY_DN6890_c0_g2_i1::g.46166::m.46166/K03861/PIGP, GPI19, DSCR5; phosphatidylinositol glycan, class P
MGGDQGTKAVYGFALWTGARVLFVVYVVWAVCPDEWLHRASVTYYPDRHWAGTLPSLFVVFVILYMAAMMAKAVFNTHPLDDPRQLRDTDAPLTSTHPP